MDYHDKLDIVKNNITTMCKKVITNNWDKMFDMWLQFEADMIFPEIYRSAFKQEYEKYMSSNSESVLYMYGKNIIYAILSLKIDNNLDDVLTFVEDFIEGQLNDFDNNCDDIMMAMFEESEAPVVEAPVVEAPIIEAPIIEAPFVEAPVVPVALTETPSISQILENLPKKAISKIKQKISKNNNDDNKKYNRKGDLTYEQFINKIKNQEGKCYICLQDFKYDCGKWCNFFPSPDRIYNYNIHTNTNIAISCTYCNLRMFKEEFAGHDVKKICTLCPGLNHTFEGYIPTKSSVFRALGNNNNRIYEYAQNPYQYYLHMRAEPEHTLQDRL